MTDEIKALTTVTPAITDIDFKATQKSIIKFVASQLKEAKNIQAGDSGDYGIIPYTKKKSLLKPGAEKLAKFFGLVPHYELMKEHEDFEKGIVMYRYRCVLTHYATGKFAGDAVRSANNKEKQVGNKTVYDAANSVEAKAQKRALVAAVVQATMASEIFDADVSDYDEEAPGKKVTEKEDPRRVKLIGALFGVATDHGWDEDWLHRAVEKKWQVKSLTEISNEQIEELRDFIIQRYEIVAKGEKPQLLVENAPKAPENNEISEGTIVEDPAPVYHCKGKIHDDMPEDQKPKVPVGEFCSTMCRDSYYPPKQPEVKPSFTFGKKNQTNPAGYTTQRGV